VARFKYSKLSYHETTFAFFLVLLQSLHLPQFMLEDPICPFFLL